LGPEDVVKSCFKWIDSAQVVFCYIDGERAFGTLFELGYAAAREKPIFLAVRADQNDSGDNGFDFVRFWEDAWFLRQAVCRAICAPNAHSAWKDFVKWYEMMSGFHGVTGAAH
jgi:hypothetical protein